MALATSVEAIARPDAKLGWTHPVGLTTDWVQLIDNLETADNSGNSITNPVTQITASTKRKLTVQGRGTTLLLMARYDDDTSVTTSPVIQAFGKDANGIWHKLKNASGTHEITVTCTFATDVQDGTYRYSDPVEVDMDGSVEVLVGIKTAYAGTTNASPVNHLLAKTK